MHGEKFPIPSWNSSVVIGFLPYVPYQGKKMSVCTDNVTDLRIPEGEAGFSKSVTAYVCQVVIIPSEVMGYKAGVSSQPVSLADRLVGE